MSLQQDVGVTSREDVTTQSEDTQMIWETAEPGDIGLDEIRGYTQQMFFLPSGEEKRVKCRELEHLISQKLAIWIKLTY